MKATDAFAMRPAATSKFKFNLLFIASSNEDKTIPEWTISQDWALLDTVSKFTVGESIHARTFWAQLAAATPILRNVTDAHLQERYNVIRSTNNDASNFSTATSASETTFSRTSVALPMLSSPPILQDWQIQTDEGRLISMSGIIENESAIWFPVQMVGNFDPDPTGSNSEVHSIASATPGGFVESVGGRVYELGQPAPVWQSNEESAAQGPWHVMPRKSIKLLQKLRRFPRKASKLRKLGRFPWMTATTATISAFLVSSILSAAIGYGSGLGITSTESREMSLTSAASLPSGRVVLRHQSSSSGSVVVIQSSILKTPTMSEQRARAELRVQREEQLLDSISERLELDRIVLQLLRLEEDAAASLGP